MYKKDNIKITLYEPWMHEQIVRMICREYPFNEESEDRLISNFYEHPYQKEKSIRIVAIDGEKVVGFQTFFRWPYLLDGKPLNTYQSGNSIVDNDYRGMGIFSRLLSHLSEIRVEKQIDFIVGFPVKMSFNSFIRNKWTNILNLNWYTKIISPFSIVRDFNPIKLTLEKSPEYIPDIPICKGFTISRDSDFESWRKAYSIDDKYFYFYYDRGIFRTRFDLKVNLRGRLKELVVGRVSANCDNAEFLKKAVNALVKKVLGQHAFTFISVALNSRYFKPEILTAFRQLGFKRIKKEISFIIKDYKAYEMAQNPELWELYRSDIDTW